jgi:hypothetical protein
MAALPSYRLDILDKARETHNIRDTSKLENMIRETAVFSDKNTCDAG